MGLTVPGVVIALLAGEPRVGSMEQAFVLLTTDRDRDPNVCLLSRAELGADRGHVYAAVAAHGTRTDLARDGRATLLACEDRNLHVCRLTATHTIAGDDMLGVAFEVRAHRRDSAGVRLAPLSFYCARSLATAERWSEASRLLGRLPGENL